MTETGEQWQQREDGKFDTDDVGSETPAHDEPFLALTYAFHQENERLVQLAEACRDQAQQLVGREARVAEREQQLSELAEALTERAAELDQREQRLGELVGRADEVSARLADASEREAALVALGAQLVERYRTSDQTGP